MTLWQGGLGKRYRVVLVSGTTDVKDRLEALGVAPGSEVCVVHKKRGAIILTVRGTRLAMGASLAQRITVERSVSA